MVFINCSICNQEFQGKRGVSIHTRRTHNISLRDQERRGYTFACFLCDFKSASNKGISAHVSLKHHISARAYYDQYYRKEGEGICIVCGNVTRYMGLTIGYCRCCSWKCDLQRSDSIRGKNMSVEGRRTQADAARQARLGKTYEQLFGGEKSKEIRLKQSRHSWMKTPKGRHFAKGRKRSPAIREKIRLSKIGVPRPDMVGELNPSKRPEVIAKIKSHWKDPEWMTKYMLSISRKPNNPETILGNILSSLCPGEYAYNEGWFTLMYKVPDFVNINGQKKVIEMYGTYWHRNDNPEDRIHLFAKKGYKTLVIWENELDNPETLSERIIDFNG